MATSSNPHKFNPPDLEDNPLRESPEYQEQVNQARAVREQEWDQLDQVFRGSSVSAEREQGYLTRIRSFQVLSPQEQLARVLEVVNNPAFALLLGMLRLESAPLETEIFMPVGDLGGTYTKEFLTGKLHGLRTFEVRLQELIEKLQEKVKPKQN